MTTLVDALRSYEGIDGLGSDFTETEIEKLAKHIRDSIEGPYGIGSDTWPGLAKLIEECGETLQVLGKIIARGGELDHTWTCGPCGGSGEQGGAYPFPCRECDGRGFLGSGDLTSRLHEELGDLQAALFFFSLTNAQVDHIRVGERAGEKIHTYQRWHAERTVAP